MTHSKCTCLQSTKNCPRYGFMLGHRWQQCQGINITEEHRQKLLTVFATPSKMKEVKDSIVVSYTPTEEELAQLQKLQGGYKNVKPCCGE